LNFKNLRNDVVVLKNGLIGIFFQSIPLLIMVISIPKYLTYLGNEKWSFISICISLLTAFFYLDFGISKSTNKFLSALQTNKYGQESKEIVFNGFILNFSFSAILGLIFLAFKDLVLNYLNIYSVKFYDEVLKIIICSGVIWMNITFFRNVFESNQHFIFTSILRSITLSVIYFPILFVQYFRFQFLDSFRLIPVIYLIIFFIYFIKALFYYKSFLLSKLNFIRMKETLSFGLILSMVTIVMLFNNTLDRQFITLFMDFDSAAYYLTSQDLISKINTISGSIGLSLMPMISSMNNSKQEIIKLYKSISVKLVFLSILLIVVFIFFGNSFLAFWVNNEFSEKSFFISFVLLIAFLINSFSILLININVGQGNLKPLLKIEFYTFILYILMLIGFSSILTTLLISFIFLTKCIIEFIFLYLNLKKDTKLVQSK